MHLDDKESDLLKTWIIKKVEAISDADSDVLADFVLALVKTEEAEAIVKVNCIENLKDFLLDGTEKFVDELFQAISTKSFDPSRPPPKPAALLYQPPKRASFDQPRLPNESRKRSYRDWDWQPDTNSSIPHYQDAERPLKQGRRGGRGYEQRGGRHSQTQIYPYSQASQQLPMPQVPTPPPGMPQIDPNNPMAAFLAMQHAMGLFMPNGGSPPNGNGFGMPPPSQRCRDYDTKGFCAAGASCPFEHGNETFVVPRFDQEYDPNNATLLNVTPTRVGRVNTSHHDRGRGSQRGRGRGGGNWRGGGKRADFSQAGPNRDTSITSIVVEQIPDEKCNEDEVRSFFAEFGNIEEVTLQPDKKLAIIKYDANDAARAAYQSPKVVFDNRFVKVYWYKPNQSLVSSNETTGADWAPDATHDTEMKDESLQDSHIDMEEITKRQEEAQRKHEAAKSQREEAAKSREDIDAKLKAMDSERKKMAEMLAKKAAKNASPHARSPAPNGSEDTEKTKVLKAQLAKLEAEAKSLGIDTDAAVNGLGGYQTYRGRGGYRGRGRGRGFYPNYRGGWAGQADRGGAVMRLDNRPKTVAITFPDGTYEGHDEALRQYLLFNSLDSATIAKHPDRDDVALVTFSQRFEGENFMASATDSELPHVGKVELAWFKHEEPANVTNGSHERDTATLNRSDAQIAETFDVADDEDLDRWS